MSHPLAPSKSGPAPGASPWPWAGRLLLLVLAGNMLIDGLEVSVVVVALPSIGADQGLSAWQVQWAMGGFALGFGALLLPGRHLALRLGHRRLYLGALALFVLASVAGGLTTDPLLLLGSRIVKGMSAALTAPTGLTIISTTYEEGPARARALSVYTFCGGIGFTTGLLLSGALTPHDWRWTFVATAPFAAVLLVLAAGAVPHRQPRPRSAQRSGPALRELLGNGALLRPDTGRGRPQRHLSGAAVTGGPPGLEPAGAGAPGRPRPPVSRPACPWRWRHCRPGAWWLASAPPGWSSSAPRSTSSAWRCTRASTRRGPTPPTCCPPWHWWASASSRPSRAERAGRPGRRRRRPGDGHRRVPDRGPGRAVRSSPGRLAPCSPSGPRADRRRPPARPAPALRPRGAGPAGRPARPHHLPAGGADVR